MDKLLALDEHFKSKNILSLSVYSDKTPNKLGHKWFANMVYKTSEEEEEIQGTISLSSVSLEGMVMKLNQEIRILGL